jgi:hypothetical protein
MDSRLGAPLRQVLQPGAPPAGQYQRQGIPGETADVQGVIVDFRDASRKRWISRDLVTPIAGQSLISSA